MPRPAAVPGSSGYGLSMNVSEFSESRRLKVKRDDCGDPIIPGKFGHLFEYGAGVFGLVLEAPADSTHFDRTLRRRKRKAIAAGFTLHQEGDVEAILLFNPADPKQTRLAIRLVGAKAKRVPSPAQLHVLRRARQARRISRTHCAEALFAT